MKTAKELELSLMIKNLNIQQLNLKVNELESKNTKALDYIYLCKNGIEMFKYEVLERILGGKNENKIKKF